MEHIPAEGPVLIIANHPSFLDPLLIGTLPRDVADAVLYVAGESGRYITGTTLVLDAGLLTR
jgi:1-acyl-sn-glycerol-3-phosphate acyltransferase